MQARVVFSLRSEERKLSPVPKERPSQSRYEGDPVSYSGPQGQSLGLDQINVLIPKSLRGRGLVNVEVVVEDLVANTVKIRVK